MIAESTAEIADVIPDETIEKWNKIRNNKSKYGFISTISKESGVPYYKVVKAFNKKFATKENIERIDSVIYNL